MYIANDLKKVVPLIDVDDITDSLIDNLSDIIYTFFSDKHMFSEEDFKIHILDEYRLQTNCNKDIFTTIYLEIDQPMNYKLDIKKKKKDTTKYTIPQLYINLADIKKGLFETFMKHFDNNNIIWLDKYSICMKSSVLFGDNITREYYFRIIPCLTYHNNNKVKGIVYYSNNDVQIEYPETFVKNFNKKNKQTKDKYRQIIGVKSLLND